MRLKQVKCSLRISSRASTSIYLTVLVMRFCKLQAFVVIIILGDGIRMIENFSSPTCTVPKQHQAEPSTWNFRARNLLWCGLENQFSFSCVHHFYFLFIFCFYSSLSSTKRHPRRSRSNLVSSSLVRVDSTYCVHGYIDTVQGIRIMIVPTF